MEFSLYTIILNEKHTAVPPLPAFPLPTQIPDSCWPKNVLFASWTTWTQNIQYSTIKPSGLGQQCRRRTSWIKSFMIYWPIKWISGHLVQVDEQLAAVFKCGTDTVSSTASCGGLLLQQPLERLSIGGEHTGGAQLLCVWETPQQPGGRKRFITLSWLPTFWIFIIISRPIQFHYINTWFTSPL